MASNGIQVLDELRQRRNQRLLDVKPLRDDRHANHMTQLKNVTAQSVDEIAGDTGILGSGPNQFFVAAETVKTYRLNYMADFSTGEVYTPIIYWGYGKFNRRSIAEFEITGYVIQQTGGNQTITPRVRIYNGSSLSTYNNSEYGYSLTIGSINVIRGFTYKVKIYPAPSGGTGVIVYEHFSIESATAGTPQIISRTTPVILMNQTGTISINEITGAQIGLVNSAAPTASPEFVTQINSFSVKVFDADDPADGVHFYTQPQVSYNAIGCDTYIQSSSVTTNFGTGVIFYVGENSGAASNNRGLIKFLDIANIPSNARVLSAKLILTISTDLSAFARTMELYRVLRNWTELGATWNTYDGSNNWATAGCGNNSTDYDGSVVWGSQAFTAAETVHKSKSITLNTAEVQKWVNGTNPNYGLLLKMQTEVDDCYGFHSSDNITNLLYAPRLEVIYELP